MRLNCADDQVIDITLSRRNLYTLLAKLDENVDGGQSFCRISFPIGKAPLYFDRQLFVHAEEDSVHYANRNAPGVMKEETEECIQGYYYMNDVSLNASN